MLSIYISVEHDKIIFSVSLDGLAGFALYGEGWCLLGRVEFIED